MQWNIENSLVCPKPEQDFQLRQVLKSQINHMV